MKRLLMVLTISCVSIFSVLGMKPDDESYLFTEKTQKIVNYVAAGDYKAASAQLALSSNVDEIGKEGVTPLLFFVGIKDKEGFEFLLNNGADPNLLLGETLSTMDYIAQNDDIFYLRKALEHGGDPNLVNGSDFSTPIFKCLRSSQLDCLYMLIEHGADINHQNKAGSTPVFTAAIFHEYKIVYKLLQLGADLSLRTNGVFGLEDLLMKPHPMLPEDKEQWRNKVINFINEDKIQQGNPN